MTDRPQHHQKRRTALGGSIALLAVLGAGAVTANQAFADEPGSDTTESSSPSPSGDTAPATPRSLTVALQAAVTEVTDGTTSHFSAKSMVSLTWKQSHEPGDDPRLGADLIRSRLAFQPADASPAAGVSVDLTDRSDPATRKDLEAVLSCEKDPLPDCESTRLPDGSLLMTWTSTGWTLPEKEPIETLHAERLVGDVLLSFQADSYVEEDETTRPTRPDAVLSTDQLVEIASQPWWTGFDLPAEFADADLPGYEESDWFTD
jgi:hypothetical protein